jgi:zinc/manganese transport system substrate-binding protein
MGRRRYRMPVRCTFAWVGLSLGLVWAVSAGARLAAGADRLRVVTSTAELKALTQAVAGDRVEVDSLVRGNQNPHDFEVRPSQMVKLRRADLVVLNGLELDAWAEVSIQGANNPRLIPGGPGRVDASAGIPVLEVPTGRVDRSMGDVHPAGNPHYTLDPGMVPTITANIVQGLARMAPEQRGAFEQGRQTFLAKLESAMAEWAQTMAPFKGTKLVVDHSLWAYFFARYGLVLAGTVEERPGIPPTPGHLVRLAALMKAEGVKALILEPWGDRKLADRLASETGAKVVLMAPGAGAVKGTDAYLDWVAYNVNALAQALR